MCRLAWIIFGVLLFMKRTSAAINSLDVSTIIRANVTSSLPGDYFNLPDQNSLSQGETFDLDETQRYLKSCQFFGGQKVQDACIFIKVIKEHWTEFLSIDTPDTGLGDSERISDFQGAGMTICNGETPKDAVCRVKGQPLSQFREFIGSSPDTLATNCTATDGLVCLNSDQPFGKSCSDYEIKFLCPRRLDPSTVSGTLYPIQALPPVKLTGPEAKGVVRRKVVPIEKKADLFKPRVCFTRARSTLLVDVKDGEPRQYYEVSVTGFTAAGQDRMFVKTFVYVGWVDAVTGNLICFWEQGEIGVLASGIGGNVKTRAIRFGRHIPKLIDVHERVNLRCMMQNDEVTTINNNQQPGYKEKRAHEFDCTTDNRDEINGAFSPLNDAHVYGTETLRMFKEYYNIDMVPELPVRIRVHYRVDMPSTYWDPTRYELIIGDGDEDHHPLSGINIIAHELAHGFTQKHSNLRYKEQSGAMNEAYSDITGEAFEHYLKGEVDWKVSCDVIKSKEQNEDALRYFECPGLDGVSVGSFNFYNDTDDVHVGSGIYNRAFMVLSMSTNWGIKKAHQVFTLANFAFWKRCTGMTKGVCGVEAAARIYGYDYERVGRVFAKVGLQCDPVGIEDCP